MKRHISIWLKIFIGLVLITILTVSLTMCSKDSDSLVSPAKMDNVARLTIQNPQFQEIVKIQERYTQTLMSHANIVGTAVGLTEDGLPAVLVLTENEMPQALSKGIAVQEALSQGKVPLFLDEAPVRVLQVGKIIPMKPSKPGPGTTTDPKAKQTPPIKLGTSGSWRYDLANGYCCGGTLGSLIKIGSTKYILSNYHVLMADIVSGDNNRTAQNGDAVIQPGLIDIGCNAADGQNVATIAFDNKRSLPGSNVDAGVAQIISGMVSEDGEILEIGTISATTVAAAINQAVKKMGRTTGLTRSTISGLNATISVAYENECAGGAAFTKTFTGQIVIANKAAKFLDSGDSGSLMVEDVSANPRAVGLLFAGSRYSAIANPIDEVLKYYGAQMVGQ